MFTSEPTGRTAWHASRGAITCRIAVKGRPSHVGLQYRGVNAFENMPAVAGALRGLKDEIEQRVTTYPLEPEQARHPILMIGGETSGGRNFNVVPERFTFTVDRRINPEENFDAERERLLELVRSAAEDVRRRGKSDRPIVAEKPSNKDWGVPHSAEEVERRGLTKGNPLRQIRSRTQRRAGSEYGQP